MCAPKGRGEGGRGSARRCLAWKLFAVLGVATAAGAGASVPAPLSAQDLNSASVAFVGGLFSYDIEGHGSDSAPFGALHFRLPMSRHVLLEPSVGWRSYDATLDSARVEAGADPDVRLLTVDFQVQAQLPLGRSLPYIGAGAGGALDLRDERGPDDFLVSTYTLAGGVAFDLGAGFGLRVETRRRYMDETRNTAWEHGLGLSLSF